jgi:hypothetical protein
MDDKDVKLAEIAKKLGTTVAVLLEGKSKEQVIQDYEQGKLQVLND